MSVRGIRRYRRTLKARTANAWGVMYLLKTHALCPQMPMDLNTTDSHMKSVIRGFGRCAFLVALSTGAACRPPGTPSSRRGTTFDTLTVMTYNVENLFDLHLDGSEYREYRPGQCNWTRHTHAAKTSNITSVLAAAAPDVAVLCEVENVRALHNLASQLKSRGAQYPHRAIADTPHPSTTCPAVLSRVPILARATHEGPEVNGKPGRNTLEVNLAMGTDVLKLFAVHWPSKHHAELTRVDAARRLLKRIGELSGGTDYLIAGDLNVNYNERLLRAFEHGASDRTISINDMMHTTYAADDGTIAYVTERSTGAGEGMRHFSPWLELDVARRWSYVYDHTPRTPDHFLLPASMFDATGVSYVDNTFEVFTWEGRLLREGMPFRWQQRHTREGRVHEGVGYSDHLPLLLRIARGPFRLVREADTGSYGWSRGHNAVRLARENDGVRVTAGPLTKNVCAARAYVDVRGAVAEEGSRLCLRLRGRGTMMIRIRAPGEKWYYYSGEHFARGRSGRYRPFSEQQWRRIVLGLRGRPGPREVELRAGKNELFDIRLGPPVIEYGNNG